MLIDVVHFWVPTGVENVECAWEFYVQISGVYLLVLYEGVGHLRTYKINLILLHLPVLIRHQRDFHQRHQW